MKLVSQRVSVNDEVALIEETIKTSEGSAKMSYLKINSECVIPVVLNEYKSSQLIKKIAEKLFTDNCIEVFTSANNHAIKLSNLTLTIICWIISGGNYTVYRKKRRAC